MIDEDDQFYKAFLAGAWFAADEFGADLSYFTDEEMWGWYQEWLSEVSE